MAPRLSQTFTGIRNYICPCNRCALINILVANKLQEVLVRFLFLFLVSFQSDEIISLFARVLLSVPRITSVIQTHSFG